MEGLPRRRPYVSFLILDSSAALAWVYGDEVTEAIRRVFDAIANNGALVPALWRLEMDAANRWRARGGWARICARSNKSWSENSPI